MDARGGNWKVLAHGPIEKLTENLWRVEGSLPGMTLKRQMTVARMSDGRLVVHSAIALEENAMREIEGWGAPAFLIVPNAFHRIDAPAFKERYPAITVLTPKGARGKVAERVAVDGAYEDFPADGSVSLETLRGVKEREGVMVVRSADGVTVVLNDVVFNMAEKPKGAFDWVMTSIFASAPGPRVSRLYKLAVVKDEGEVRGDLERLAGMNDLKRVVVAHGEVASGGRAAEVLREAAGGLG